MIRPLLLALVLVHLAVPSLAQSGKPRVPPGRDPGGIAVALLCTGIDYTLPAIAARLARDGEGEPIAWDVVENDNRPFDRSGGRSPAHGSGDATAIASAMLERMPALRLVVVRVDPADATSLARAVAFVARTPARIAVVPIWSRQAADWELFRQAAVKFRDILFVVAAGDEAGTQYPASLTLDNLLATAVAGSGRDAVGFAGAVYRLSALQAGLAAGAADAAELLRREPALDARQARQRLVEAGTPKR